LTTTTADVVYLHETDNVCVAGHDLMPGAKVSAGGRSVELTEHVAFGHKIALTPIAVGEQVRKYGQPIGEATQPIQPGQWVHTHNLSVAQLDQDYTYASEVPPAPDPIEGRTFMGYRRADGRAGTRNWIAVVSTVNCSASVARRIAAHFDADALAAYPNIDGVMALTHKGGCAMAFDGEDHQQLMRVMAGFARHPNVGGCLIVGLGCETATTSHLVQVGGLNDVGDTGTAPTVLVMQACGGTTATIAAGVKRLKELLPQVDAMRRQPIPASELLVGTECGGSDASSGITANPALGAASDKLVAVGATAILSEVPEIFGAEHLLTRRAVSEEVGRKLIDRIEWWKRYAGAFGVKIDDNRSPGNAAGGLTTINEKSLGAVAKGGTTALSNVYRYAEQVNDKGFVIMDTPGYDPASVTGMIAGGANIICFTTGRGSCFGSRPTPSIKIASNTPMYQRMIEDMDVDAGVIYRGATVAELGSEIFELILKVASGQKTKSEALDLGDEEFSPWSIGPVL
jgi:altronate hydrolase